MTPPLFSSNFNPRTKSNLEMAFERESLPPTGINRHRRLRKKNRKGVHCCEVWEKDVIFAKKRIMLQENVGLNNAQLDFLRLLAHFTTEEEVKELNDLVCEYYARKVDEEIDRLWDEGKWNAEKIEETLHEHLRTPYHD